MPPVIQAVTAKDSFVEIVNIMNHDTLANEVNQFWDDKILPTLVEYIKIPNKSPSFDPDWEKHGHMDRERSMEIY